MCYTCPRDVRRARASLFYVLHRRDSQMVFASPRTKSCAQMLGTHERVQANAPKGALFFFARSKKGANRRPDGWPRRVGARGRTPLFLHENNRTDMRSTARDVPHGMTAKHARRGTDSAPGERVSSTLGEKNNRACATSSGSKKPCRRREAAPPWCNCGAHACPRLLPSLWLPRSLDVIDMDARTPPNQQAQVYLWLRCSRTVTNGTLELLIAVPCRTTADNVAAAGKGCGQW